MEQTLQPDEQMWIDVGKLIREHVPDKTGKILPADLTSGSYEIRDLTDIGAVSLFEGKVIFDKTYGHAAYGCATCCDYQRPTLDYNPLSIPFKGTSQNGVGAYQWCADHYTDVSNYFINGWKTGSTAITTVNYMGTYTGTGVGSTTAGACGYIPTGQQRNCPAYLLCLNGSANVEPCDFTISPGGISNADCTGKQNSVTYVANVTPNLGFCAFQPSQSSCSFTVSGAIESGTNTNNMSPASASCAATYFAGPGASGTDVGTITFKMSLRLGQTTVSHSQTAQVVCK